MQETPLIEGICNELLQAHAPMLIEAVKTHTRALGHEQLFVPETGPVLNRTVRQFKQTLLIITLVVKLQMHYPPLIT